MVCEVQLKNPNREALLRHGRSVKHNSNKNAKAQTHDISQLLQNTPKTAM